MMHACVYQVVWEGVAFTPCWRVLGKIRSCCDFHLLWIPLFLIKWGSRWIRSALREGDMWRYFRLNELELEKTHLQLRDFLTELTQRTIHLVGDEASVIIQADAHFLLLLTWRRRRTSDSFRNAQIIPTNFAFLNSLSDTSLGTNEPGNARRFGFTIDVNSINENNLAFSISHCSREEWNWREGKWFSQTSSNGITFIWSNEYACKYAIDRSNYSTSAGKLPARNSECSRRSIMFIHFFHKQQIPVPPSNLWVFSVNNRPPANRLSKAPQNEYKEQTSIGVEDEEGEGGY